MLKPWLIIYEGEGGDSGDGGEGGEDGGEVDKKFSQDDVNKMLAEDRRKHKATLDKTIRELEALRTKKSLTDDERKELDKRIEELNTTLLTKEELAKKEKDKIIRKHQEEQEKLSNELTSWKSRFTDSTVKRSITDAAVEFNAFVPEQIVAILHPMTRLSEIMDGDTPTGEYVAKVRFPDTDKDGKPITLDLAVPEAVKRMTEIEKYFNLFRTEGTGGLNSRPVKGSENIDIREIAKDPKKYREARKAGKILGAP